MFMKINEINCKWKHAPFPPIKCLFHVDTHFGSYLNPSSALGLKQVAPEMRIWME